MVKKLFKYFYLEFIRLLLNLIEIQIIYSFRGFNLQFRRLHTVLRISTISQLSLKIK